MTDDRRAAPPHAWQWVYSGNKFIGIVERRADGRWCAIVAGVTSEGCASLEAAVARAKAMAARRGADEQ
jgi:hypothetical protein